MLNAFSWNRSLFYGAKMYLSDFDTKNPQSLDYLLKQMYMLGYKNGHLQMKNSLPALNAAYYVAVAIANTEGIDETNLKEEITTSIRTILYEDFCRYHKNTPSSNRCPFAEMMLIEWMVYAILWLQENKSKEMEYYYTDYMWTGTVSKYNINDMLWQLSFIPSQKEQHDFLDWAKKMSDKHKESGPYDLPF